MEEDDVETGVEGDGVELRHPRNDGFFQYDGLGGGGLVGFSVEQPSQHVASRVQVSTDQPFGLYNLYRESLSRNGDGFGEIRFSMGKDSNENGPRTRRFAARRGGVFGQR